MPTNTCSTCKHFHANGHDPKKKSLGECRRLPPVTVLVETTFPQIERPGEIGCGEWQTKPPPTP